MTDRYGLAETIHKIMYDLDAACPSCGFPACIKTGDVHTCMEFISDEYKCPRCDLTWCRVCWDKRQYPETNEAIDRDLLKFILNWNKKKVV